MNMHSSLRIFDNSIFEFIRAEFEIEHLVNDCKFTEGPVWHDEGHYLFSDITANTIYKLVPGRNREILVSFSGTEALLDEDLKPDQIGSNGLAWDNKGSLLVCRHGSHMVAKWNGKSLEPFITSYKGKPFNSPNDIIVDERGRIFFSDPPYGLKDGKLNAGKFQPLGGVYCHDAGETTLVCDKYQYPNGVCLAPDGKSLYICSNKPFEKFISVYDLETLAFQKILAEENSDGIKCDPHGNVYLSNKDGILILNSDGKRLALIKFPTIPANQCFGGAEKKDLFVTARENVFLIRTLLR
jgi:gluconolactonase